MELLINMSAFKCFLPEYWLNCKAKDLLIQKVGCLYEFEYNVSEVIEMHCLYCKIL